MKRIDTLFDTDARRLSAEDRRIRTTISRTVPSRWQAGLLFARLDGTFLHLTVRSAACVTNLRFHESAIRRKLAEAGVDCRGIRWHVAVEDSAPQVRRPRRYASSLPGAAARQLRAVAATMDDELLRRELLRLAGQARGDAGKD